jgi:hypothetical protein
MDSRLPKLILLPGMDGTGELFKYLQEALLDEFDVKVVRYPTDRNLSYSQLMRFVDSAAPVSEPYVLVAESFSTPLAILYARVKSTKLERPGDLCRIRYKPSEGLRAAYLLGSSTGFFQSSSSWVRRQTVVRRAEGIAFVGGRRTSCGFVSEAERVIGQGSWRFRMRRTCGT